LDCHLCKNVANKPIRCTNCNHYFCNICIIEYRNTNATCPVESCA
jgi:hypothetical protein